MNHRSPGCKSSKPFRAQAPAAAAFTLTELLVLIGVLALLVAMRLPALCRARMPVHLLQCMSNCRQLAQAVLLYRADNHDACPFGNRVYGAGTNACSIVDPTGWPMQTRRYLGPQPGSQPPVWLCPSEEAIADNWPLQLHYQANRVILSDTNDRDTPILGAQVRNPAIYWLFLEKGPWDYASVRPGGLANPVLPSWNYPPGWPQYRRHSGGMTAAAADGHVEWLRTPPYQPGRPPPQNFGELGDCANGERSPSTWIDEWLSGYTRKLYCRYSIRGF